jgi:hypothetical protein
LYGSYTLCEKIFFKSTFVLFKIKKNYQRWLIKNGIQWKVFKKFFNNKSIGKINRINCASARHDPTLVCVVWLASQTIATRFVQVHGFFISEIEFKKQNKFERRPPSRLALVTSLEPRKRPVHW